MQAMKDQLAYLTERLEASERKIAAAAFHSGLANPGSIKARLPKSVRLALEALLVQPLAVVRAITSPSAAHPVPLGDDAPGTDLLATFLRQQQEAQEAKSHARPPTIGGVLGALVILMTLEADALAQQPVGAFGPNLTPQGAAEMWVYSHMLWTTSILLRLPGPLAHSAAGLEAALDNFRRAGGLNIRDQLHLHRGAFSTATVEDAILAGQAAAAAAARPAAEDKAPMRRPNSSEAQRRLTSGFGRSEPRTPCYKYNLEGICGVAGCKLAHVCSACSGRHPARACPRGQGSNNHGSGSSGGALARAAVVPRAVPLPPPPSRDDRARFPPPLRWATPPPL